MRIKEKLRINIFELNKLIDSNNKNKEKNLIKINLDNNYNTNSKLNSEDDDDDITEFEEKYYFDEHKITLKEKLSFINYIIIGIIISFHSIHFILSEYVSDINILILFNILVFYMSLPFFYNCSF